MGKKAPPESMTGEEKASEMLLILRQMNRRDKWRIIGGTIRSIIGIIPIILFLLSMWYLYAFGDELLNRMSAQAMRQASGAAASNLLENLTPEALQQWFGRGESPSQ